MKFLGAASPLTAPFSCSSPDCSTGMVQKRARQIQNSSAGDLLPRDPPLARQALRSLMAGAIWFAPQKDGYRLHGTARPGALWPQEIAGETRAKMASPRGFEPPCASDNDVR
jgi:hypothetical protein